MAGAINYPISAPSISSMYSTPYGIVTSYNFYGETYEGKYKDSVSVNIGGVEENSTISLIINIFEQAAKNEEAREQELFNNYISLIPPNTKLRLDFEALIRGKQYSQALDTLQKVMNYMYDFDKTLKENQEIFAKTNDLYLTGNFLHSVMDELGRSHHAVNQSADFGQIDLSMTGEQLIANIVNNVREIAKERMDDKQLVKYEAFLQKIQKYIQEIFIDSYGVSSLNNSLQSLEQNKTIQDKRKESKYSNVPLNRLIYNQIFGLLNGMGLEVTIDLNGGVKTGTIMNNNGMIKTDDIILMSTTHSLTFQDNPDLKKELEQITTKYDLERFLQQGSIEKNFIIMASAKDQSFSKDFNGYFGSHAIKFAEEASLIKRIADLRDFGSAIGNLGVGIDDLIFALVNLESDMVCAGQINSVKQALGAVCVNWMFDDLGDVVLNVPLQNSATKICVYNVNGWYYTLSDILRRTIQKINSKKNSDLVSVKLKIPKGSSYEAAQGVHEGIERWEATRENIMANTSLGFDLKVKNLFNAFY